MLIRGNCRRWCAARQSFLHRLDVTSERTRTSLLLRGAGDFDLELLESRTLDEHTQELVFRAPPIRQLERLQSVTNRGEPRTYRRRHVRERDPVRTRRGSG